MKIKKTLLLIMIRIKNKKINLLRNGKTILQKNLIKAIKGYMIIKNMLIIKENKN